MIKLIRFDDNIKSKTIFNIDTFYKKNKFSIFVDSK